MADCCVALLPMPQFVTLVIVVWQRAAAASAEDVCPKSMSTCALLHRCVVVVLGVQ